MSFKDLNFLFERAQSGKVMKIVIAAAEDGEVLEAVKQASSEGIVDAVLVGDPNKISEVAKSRNIDVSSFEVIPATNDEEAAMKAVQAVSSGKGDLLMKGFIKTSTLLKAVLNKEWGLRTGNLLSHLFLFEVPRLGKVIGLTDGGLNTYPGLQEKVAIVNNAVSCYHALGVDTPKVAALAAVEVVNPDMPCTLDAAALVQMNRRNQIKGCIIDGPLALDNALSVEAAKHKGIVSEVAGSPDILLVPDIEAGNLLGKVILFMANGAGAGVVLGAKVPVVLTSRGDTARTKALSIALGAVLAKN
ncbi:MAG TPA: bifunctional enoyl-CoA hydratase/phosphate acetyltransferase [Acetomicrobium flavidum]|uniref:bifunctional enoyl-CoA hydratase/phosphate acetyltransferase n=1 Tax=Acetomicrobium flavidum TaxID=49896 RepID=UPI002C48F8C4|nr:bifunctional enoyl-CoA hydratase/phosphate acetyltransferase [Acetomicrobium flavidum]HOM31677.1 bifunctional enoyl-CoA hydratase/phosphate acetyltransferase [Acetomicrobium flavidum]HPP14881.1 bifunctional enoyl-CoA hydratase/phosphate acetyltransferase [Acetomicrobium flavidum]HPU69501.1 bifunctional enoyl-CoA hydratase/phosphate acetyltransferase [Acetomicrobium flavidum]